MVACSSIVSFQVVFVVLAVTAFTRLLLKSCKTHK